jgi:hypothetical protein
LDVAEQLSPANPAAPWARRSGRFVLHVPQPVIFGFPAHFARTLAIEHTCPMRVRACTHRPALQRAERIERCSTWRYPASSANDGAWIRLLGILAERIRFRT